MNNIITSPPTNDIFLSDHSTVLCDLNVTKAVVMPGKHHTAKTQSIDFNSFKRHSLLHAMPDTPDNLDRLIDCYMLSNVLDKHAPLRTRHVLLRPRCSMVFHAN